MSSGLVIIDASCIKHFEKPAVFQLIRGSLRSAHLEIWLTALNVLEIAKTRNHNVRARLLAIAKELSLGQPLIPDPQTMLRLTAEAALDGKGGFHAPRSGIEWLLEDASGLTPELIGKVEERARAANDFLEDGHKEMRGYLKRLGSAKVTEAYQNASSFLQTQWMRVEQQDVFIAGMWHRLGFAGAPPIALLFQIEAWRLYLEGFGVAIYRRAVAREQGKIVQTSDLSQLVYLAGRRGILVTEDKEFHEVAKCVLKEHPQRRVMMWREFLAGATP